MFLRDIWYFAMPGEALKGGGLASKVLLGEPLVFGRTRQGEPFALRDICPHRGVPLSAGHLYDARSSGCGEAAIECPYHGWKFNTSGACTEIPSLVPGQDMDVSRIRVRRYPVREVNGNIWVYMTDEKRADLAPTHEPPAIPGFDGKSANIRESMTFSCHVDHAVIGLMDPAHGPFVHRSWYWRTKASIHEKAKDFAPSEMGFAMVEHTPSSNSFAYRILGGKPTTEISFRLPGIRLERIHAGRHRVVGLTAVTPIDETSTEITQSFYWTLPVLSVAKPVLRRFMRAFLGQDRDMVNLQQRGLRFEPRLMLINDSDVQAKWYHRLKNEWDEATAQGRPFQNPVKPVTLRWRS
ncbi:MAG: aromatic ring-hydroxylating dioxygenase subunit alpha [Parvibaculum sp.]|uniref:Rieske 2Fe-2S domain-containing protein n=1 Tax=Parvibaculum sp. TaxID=2024848 RepID=UPI003C73AB86